MLQKRVADPNDKISQIIDNDTLKWAHYTRSVSKVLEEANSHGVYAPAAVVLQIRDSVGNMNLAESIPTPSSHIQTLGSSNAPAPGEYMPTPPDVIIGTQDPLHDNTTLVDFGVGLWPDDYGFAFMSEHDIPMSNFYYGMDYVGDRPSGW